MRILFLGRHYTYFRNFESVLRELASHGHAIHLAVERDETLGGTRLVEGLAAEYPNLTYGDAPGRADDDWTWAAGRLRLGLDYLRYQHRVFDEASTLRARARVRTPGAFVALGDAVHAAGGWSRTATSAILRRLERAVPEDPAIPAFLEDQRPDVVLLTPLIDLGSSQIDYLRAARARGIPTALCVWSWDHLSSKALIRESPDRVFVWNHTQKQEAMELHGVPGARVVVTGAQCFDQWFERAPSRGRDQFCRDAGLPPDRPILLYACSALIHGSPIEALFVVEWIRRLRASASPALREAAILVRPHPSRMAEWDGIDLREWDAVVWGANPVDAQAKADYFDSLFYCAAVAGLNTSAFIEAGIVGRPVHAIVVPQFEANQYGTVHFRYLVNAGGGLLHVARDFDEHFGQLDAALATPVTEVRPFVREFVRPAGLDRAATPIFVREVEEMRGLRAERTRVDALLPVWRWGLDRMTRARTSVRLERWTMSVRELESVQRIRQLHEDKAIRRAEARAASDAGRTRKLQIRAARREGRAPRAEAPPRMKKRLFVAVQVAVTSVLVWYLMRGFDWAGFVALFERLPLWFYVLSLVSVSLGQAVYAWRWWIILQAADVRIRFRTVLQEFLVGNFVNTFVPSTVGGDAARVYYVGRDHGYRTVTATVILDRLLGFGLLALLGLVAMSLAPDLAPAFTATRAALGVVVGATFVALLAAVSGTGGLARRVGFLGAVAVRAAEHLQSVRLDMAAAVTSPRAMLGAASTVVIYFTMLTGLYDIYIRIVLGHAVSFLSLLTTVAVVALVSNLPVSISGLGVREQMHVLMLRPLGVPKEQAVAISLLLFATALVTNMVGGYFWIRRSAAPVSAPRPRPEPFLPPHA